MLIYHHSLAFLIQDQKADRYVGKISYLDVGITSMVVEKTSTLSRWLPKLGKNVLSIWLTVETTASSRASVRDTLHFQHSDAEWGGLPAYLSSWNIESPLHLAKLLRHGLMVAAAPSSGIQNWWRHFPNWRRHPLLPLAGVGQKRLSPPPFFCRNWRWRWRRLS